MKTNLADIKQKALPILKEAVLGQKTDVVTYNSLNSLLRDRILSEQVRIL